MTGYRSRLHTVRSAAFTVAALSQLQGWVSGPLVLTTLSPTQKTVPFFSAEQTVPTWPRRPHAGFVASAPAILTTPAVNAFGVGRHAGDDQPNPLGPRHPISLRTWTQSVRLPTGPESTQTGGGHWPNPQGPRHPHVGFVASYQAILAVAPAVLPEGQRSLADYAAPGYPISLRTWTPAPLVLSPLAHSIPTGRLAGLDQPNPRGYPFPISDRGFTESSSLSLLYTEPPDVTTVFRNPLITRWARRPHTDRGFTESSSLSLLYPPVITTVFRDPLITRWAKRPHPVDLLTIAGPSFMASGPLTTQLRSGDWQNPRGPRYPVSLRTWTQGFLGGPLSVQPEQIPIGERTPENPQRRVHPVSLLTWVQNLLQTTLLPVPPVPPQGRAVLDVPSGPTYPVSLRTLALGLQQTTLEPPPEDQPDGKWVRDWPNPRGYEYPVSLRTHIIDLSTTTLLGQDEVPISVVNDGTMIVLVVHDQPMVVLQVSEGRLKVDG